MGQRHRSIRKALKAEIRVLEAQGWHENEFGELKRRTTKADARRWLLRCKRSLDAMTKASLEAGERMLMEMRPQMQEDILNRLSETITLEMDREILGP